jgi:hypothetical protein
MASIEVIIRDDEGKVIGKGRSQTYSIELGQQTLQDIEGGVEGFKQQALPEIEQILLNYAQSSFTEGQKKRNDL